MEINSYVRPKPNRTTVTDTGNGLRVEFIPEWSWATFLWLTVWLPGWAFGLRMAVTDFWIKALDRGDWFGIAFITVWAAGWIWGGLFALISWLGNFSSKEVLLIDSEVIRYRREVLGIGYEKTFDVVEVHGVRYLPPEGAGRSRKSEALGFEYGSRTKRLMSDLTELEIQSVVKAINSRFPHFGGTAS